MTMQILNRYSYNPQTDLAGKTGFSRVYRAIDDYSGSVVAVKIYRVAGPATHYRAIPDASSALALQHPALCSCLHVEQIEKEDSYGDKEVLQVCIAEFMNAGHLLHHYRQHKNIGELKKMLITILQGLSYLHDKGIIHGHINPSNLMMHNTGNEIIAKITDAWMGQQFGAQNGSAAQSQPLITDMAYLSPEQLEPNTYGVAGKVSYNTDLWSLALVMYEALTGRPVFTHEYEGFQTAVTAHTSAFAVPADAKDLPYPFNEIIALCLEKNASSRVKSAGELLALLNASAKENRTATDASGKAEANTDDTMVISPRQYNSILDDQPHASALTPSNNDQDETQIIKPFQTSAQEKHGYEKSDNSSANPGKQAITAAQNDTDDTQIVKKTPESKGLNDDVDDTAIINVTKPAGRDEDMPAHKDSKPQNDQPATESKDQPVNNADGQTLLKLPGEQKPALAETPEENAAEDQTIIITKLEKDAQSAERGKKEPAPDDIIIRRRGKPVVLFNRYEYSPAADLIGKGGFSRVYKAFDGELSRWVALKIYKTGEFSDRYSPIAEIKRVVNLDHPNICRYLDIEEMENENPFGENEKIQVCVMELLDSGNFSDFYKTNKDPHVLKKLLNDVLYGLAYLHKNDIIHRDIKPGNILIKQNIEGPVAKITDFGISKNSDAGNNSTSALVVSIPYMAPEQLNAKKYGIDEKISYNLDLWSLGVTVFELITGNALFKNSEQDTSEQIIANIMAPELPAKLQALPEPFKTLVSHCVVKNARERAAKAEELMVLLNSIPISANNPSALAAQAANIDNASETAKHIPIHSLVPEPLIQDENITTPIQPVTTAPFVEAPKRKFSIAEEDDDKAEKAVVIPQKKKTDYVRIGVSAGALLLIFLLVFKTCSYMQQKANPLPAKATDNNQPIAKTKKDSVGKNVTVPEKADSNKEDILPEEKEETSANTEAKPVIKKKDKPEEHETTIRKPTTTEPAGNAQKFVLRLTTPYSCSVKVNGVDYGELYYRKVLNVYLVPGRYVLEFKALNRESFYTTKMEVRQDQIGKTENYHVPL